MKGDKKSKKEGKSKNKKGNKENKKDNNGEINNGIPKKRGRPRKVLTPETKVLIPEIIEEEETKPIAFKEPLTEKEISFLELLFEEKQKRAKDPKYKKRTVIELMKSVGYKQNNEPYLYTLGKKIVEKYELLTEDKRKIMRALGWGEVRAIESLIEAATLFKSETVRLNARIALAKCHGLQTEFVDGIEGISIIVGRHTPGTSPPPEVGQSQPAPIGPPRPIAILK